MKIIYSKNKTPSYIAMFIFVVWMINSKSGYICFLHIIQRFHNFDNLCGQIRYFVVKSALEVAKYRSHNLYMPVTLLAIPSIGVSCLFHCHLVQLGNFFQIFQKSLFVQIRHIEIIEHPHHSLYIYLLYNRCLIRT